MSDTNLDQLVEPSPKPARAKRGLEIRRTPEFVAGGLPTVSLLPRELKAAARSRSIQRAFAAGVVVAVILAGGATAGAMAIASAAQSRLDASNAASQQLLSQLSRFQDVQMLQQSIRLGEAAVMVGSSTEIDWQAQIDAVEALMPSGWTVTSIQGDSASPVLDYSQGTSPLDVPSVASVQMAITTSDISSVGPWLRKLRGIPAYGDATASVISDDTTGYTIQLTLHLTPKALVNAGKAAK
ncbi:hypothetical protein [Amnibacterium kyonggiense]|uniref:Tfp pilus assembly protein PilN n=1 Tax=Amnibacterium kyonggiense TaxID=595671 RepID=A0A4R7FQP8_9MICO|nr:hypothetical protein [Amnibacterium kyonggiense]TDS80110.1 hypothetical protein CLV52_0663 [Amnibacterium kyonggiense]